MSEQQSPHGVPDPAPGPGGTQTPGGPAGPPAQGPHLAGMDTFFHSVRRMGVTRSDDRWVGGVAAGVAQRFGLDPLLVRGIFFVSFFITGAGLVLYGIGWALLPERSDGRIHLQQAIRGQFDIAMLGALAAVIVGLSTGGIGLSWWNVAGLGWINGLLWLAALGAIAWLIVSAVTKKKAQGGPPTAGGATGGPAGAGPATPSNPTVYPAPSTWAAPVWTAQDAPQPEDPQPVYAAPAPAAHATAAPAAAATAPVPPAPSHAGLHDHSGVHAPTPPKAPKPPKTPRAQGPGPVLAGIVVGLSLLAGAALLLLERVSHRGAPLFIAWIGIALGLAGLGIVISGLRGRRSGVLGFLAIVGLLVGIPAAGSWADNEWVNTDWGRNQFAMSGTQVITDPSVAQNGLSVGFGSPTYDLSGLDLSSATTDDPVRVPIELGAGSVRVIVPDGAAVAADVTVGAGHVEWNVDGADESVSGRGGSRTFTSAEAADGALLVLDVEVGAGNLTITEG